MAHCRNDIGNYRTGCWKLTGSHSVKHSGSQTISNDANTVVNSIYRKKRILFIHHHGSYIGKILVLHGLHGTQKLDAQAQCLSIGHIDITDITNSFCINVFMATTIAGSHGKQNSRLSGGVEAIHIRRGIPFRIAQSLCLLQGIFKAGAFFSHLG